MTRLLKRIALLAVAALFPLGGVAMVVAGIVMAHRATSGPIDHVRVAECHYTGTGRSSVCTGAFVVGGALVGGAGHVVIGTIENANFGDVGHVVEVRVHGDTAYMESLRVPIILIVMGLFIAVALGYLLVTLAVSSRPRKPPPAIAGLAGD